MAACGKVRYYRMAFSDFTFPNVSRELGLTLSEATLFGPVAAVPFR